MALSLPKHPVKFFFTGSILLFLGLAKVYIDQEKNWPSIALAVVGLSFIVAALIALSTRRSLGHRIQTVKQCLVFTLFIVVLLALTIAANVIAYRFNQRWDLTAFRQHSLTAETKGLIAQLNKDVRMTALFVGLPPKYLEDLLKEYERASKGKIKTEIIDPIVQIGYAAQFGNVISGKESKLIVQAGNDRRDVDFSEAPLTEEQINNGLTRVTREARHVYFVSGHQEYGLFEAGDTGLSTFAKQLLANNYFAHELVLDTVDKIPDDCHLLVIAGPKQELSDKEVKKINDYLLSGGEAFIMTEHTVVTTPDVPLKPQDYDKNPSLNNLLKEWGLQVNRDIVVDLASHASGDVGSPATRNYLTHKAIVSGLDYTFYVRPRSISMLSDRRKSIKVAPLVLTASEKQSWGETNRTLEIKFDEKTDRPGPVPIAFVAWDPNEGKDFSDTRLVLFTDADFLTNVYIGSYSNANMGLNAVNWLTESPYEVLVNKSEVKVEELKLTSQQKRVVGVILIFIPLLIALIGIGLWMKYSLKN